MLKFIAFFAVLAVAAAKPGLLQTHAVVQPAVIDTSASSAITHQSFVNLERKVPVVPVVHSYAAAPVVHHAAAVPVVKTIHHAASVVQTYAAAPVVHSVPIVHAAPIVSSPVYTTYHH